MVRFRHIDDEQVEATRVSSEFASDLERLLCARIPTGEDDLSDLQDVLLLHERVDDLLTQHRGDWVVRDSSGKLFAISHATFQETYLPDTHSS